MVHTHCKSLFKWNLNCVTDMMPLKLPNKFILKETSHHMTNSPYKLHNQGPHFTHGDSMAESNIRLIVTFLWNKPLVCFISLKFMYWCLTHVKAMLVQYLCCKNFLLYHLWFNHKIRQGEPRLCILPCMTPSAMELWVQQKWCVPHETWCVPQLSFVKYG